MTESKDQSTEPLPRKVHETDAAVGGERLVASGRAPLADAAADESVTSVTESAEATPAERQIAQARELADGGDLTGAIAAARHLLATHPQDLHARRELAGFLERRGDLEGAAAELSRALESRPEDVALLCSRAVVLTALKRFDKAEADLRRAAKLDDTSADVQLNLGVLFCKRARWREAVAPLQRAVELEPGRALAHYHLAEAYNQTDQLRDALASYEAVVRLEPQNYRALKGIGVVLDRMGRPAEATMAYQKAREVQRR